MNDLQNNVEVITVEMDTTLKKQLGFLSVIYQVFGVLTIISGAMMCLGIITAIVGVPYIMAGLKMFKSGGSFGETTRNLSGDSLKSALGDLSKAMKIALIAMVLLFVVYFIIFIIIMVIGIAANSY